MHIGVGVRLQARSTDDGGLQLQMLPIGRDDGPPSGQLSAPAPPLPSAFSSRRLQAAAGGTNQSGSRTIEARITMRAVAED